MKKRFRISMTPPQLILLGFAVVILLGSLLLALPISTKSGQAVSYTDALFTATSATCVTGLVTLSTVATWSIFGQVIILLLIQIGGLGVITVMAGIMLLLQKRFGIKDRVLLQDSFNLNTLSGLVIFLRKVIAGTFIIESLGAVLYMTVFVPHFGVKGIWISVFNSVSAFCNAGIDIISDYSLCDFAHNPVVNITTCLLIFMGGIGFIVWWDVLDAVKKQKAKWFKHLTLHSKIALSSSVFLILAGAVLIFVFEYNNPDTIKDFSLFDKIQASVFQSVTTRTAGFMTIPQQNLTNPSSYVSLLLMFIGGSPAGTAGGIKTVTFTVLIASSISAIKNRNETVLFNRSIPKLAVSKAVAVTSVSFATMFLSTVFLSIFVQADALDIIFETISATATVGLSRNLTSSLNEIGKIIIIITMYIGRVGPITLATMLSLGKVKENIIKNPVEDISIG